MSEEIAETIVDDETSSNGSQRTEAIEVTIKKEPEKKEPDVDYDNYLPTEKEIIETEIEIEENTNKRRVKQND